MLLSDEKLLNLKWVKTLGKKEALDMLIKAEKILNFHLDLKEAFVLAYGL